MSAPSAPQGGVTTDDLAVLLRIKAALPDAGLRGWFDGVQTLDRVIATLSAQPRADAAQQPPAEAQAPTLWCMHIHGPDDVHPAPSKEAAEQAAKAFNERYAPIAERTGVMAKAVVAEWPHSPESHAESVGTFLFDWIIPVGHPTEVQVQAQGGGDDGMLPDALVPHADEWYRLCERRFAVDRITISGELAEAIVDAINAKAAPPSAPVGVEGLPLRYFAYDGDNGDYIEFDTLAEAIASAKTWLSYEGDDAWPDGGPSIYYGAVLGEAREVEGSRRAPGPHDNHGFDAIVEYEMTDATALAQQPAADESTDYECPDCGKLNYKPLGCANCGYEPPALAQQPAAVDGAWRLLARGEAIEKGDEILADDCVQWTALSGWEIGLGYDSAAFVPVRRWTPADSQQGGRADD